MLVFLVIECMCSLGKYLDNALTCPYFRFFDNLSNELGINLDESINISSISYQSHILKL